MNYTIKQIEDAIILALAPVATSQGGVVKTLGSYEGQFEETVDAVNQSISICPAVLVTYLGSAFTPAGAPLFDRVLRFALLHASSNLRSETKRRQDGYALLDTTKALLNNKTLGLDVTPLLIERESIIATSRKLTIFSAEYKTSFLEDAGAY